MSRLGVFKSRRVLLHDYTPSKLPHRERHLKDLKRYFEPVLREDINVKVHVHGSIGTGKTVLCSRLGSDLEGEAVLRASTPQDNFRFGVERVTRSLSVSV